ncbi:MAG: GNAT family N-acetyltransferase [Planctomycetaceae bacterium]
MSEPAEQAAVRPATGGDLSAVEALIAPFVAEGRLLPRTTDELEDLLPTGFVAELAGQVVGFATLEIYSRKFAEIRSLCVARDLQGHGIGHRLVGACVELARERRIFEVMVISSQEHFFLTCGFDFTLPGEKKALFLQTRDEP